MDMKTDLVQWDTIERDASRRVASLTAWRGARTARAQAYKFLVPVDGSAASTDALHVALRMAGRVSNAEIHVLNVQIRADNDEQDDIVARDGLHQTRHARTILDRMKTPHLLRIATGNPAEAIRAHARDAGIAEIVMGSRGAGRIERLLMGSVAMDVAEAAGVPVTLVKAHERDGYLPVERVDWLAPCDGSENSVRAIRHLAGRLARQKSRSWIHLLNVQESTHPVPVEAVNDDESPGRYRQQAVRICNEAIDLLNAAKLDYLFHVRIGDPVTQILRAVGQFGCGHVVMGSRGRGLFGKLVLGSVSHGVSHGASVPVTLIT